MLVDWITARIPFEHLSPEALVAALGIGDRITRYDAKTGEEVYTTMAWDSVRSDSHQISIRRGTEDLWIQGSPARVMGDGCTVFGSGASAALDLIGCVDRMKVFVESRLDVLLPSANLFKVSRVDVTGNLALGSLEEVRQALGILRNCEGGRYRVNQQAGDTVYWQIKSKLRKAKAYAKGPHLRHLMKQKTYEGRQYSEADIQAAGSLLRLELTLGREFFSRNPWQDFTASKLKTEWEEYFFRMIGDAEMKPDDLSIQQRIEAAAPTEGQGKAAYGCWVMIQQNGWERARTLFSKPTWYRHIKTLRDSGLGDADISAGNVVAIRRNVLSAQMVTSWDQIAA